MWDQVPRRTPPMLTDHAHRVPSVCLDHFQSWHSNICSTIWFLNSTVLNDLDTECRDNCGIILIRGGQCLWVANILLVRVGRKFVGKK
jgi:hypothetical protein